MASFVQYNMLIMLHPFIPFFTEKMWLDLKLNIKLKSPLMYKSWNLPTKPNVYLKKSFKKIDWITKLITTIRSAKVDLDVSPGDFIEISVNELNKEKKSIIDDNIVVFKRLARIENIHEKKPNKQGVNIIVGIDTVTLYFGEKINLTNQRLKFTRKYQDLENKVLILSKKLKNKSFLQNAPKIIVQKEKKSLNNYKVELKKLNSILNSINN